MWRAGVEGSKQRVRVVSVNRVLWSVTNEVGFVMAGMPLKQDEGGSHSQSHLEDAQAAWSDLGLQGSSCA